MDEDMNDSPIPPEAATVPVEDGAIAVTVFRRTGAPGPALVIAPSAFGITDDLVGQMATLAAGAGVVVAMDLFFRDHPGPIAYDDMGPVMQRLQALDKQQALADFRAVIAWARTQPECNGRVLGLGICFGGPFVFLAASEGLLEAVATWHGTRLEDFLAGADAMRGPMALHFGDRDRVVPMAAVQKVRAAFEGRDDVAIAVHAGADHGFTHPTAPTWNAEAAAAAMSSVRQLLVALT